MNLKVAAILTILPFLAVACGGAEDKAPPATAPATGGVQKVVVKGMDNMQYDTKLITTKVGAKLEITFENVGKMPKEAMGHNFVVLKKGTDVAAFATAGMTHKDTDYIAAEKKDQVLVHSKLLGPGEKDTIVFEPKEAGDYPYVCTFPGHFAMMQGVIKVN